MPPCKMKKTEQNDLKTNKIETNSYCSSTQKRLFFHDTKFLVSRMVEKVKLQVSTHEHTPRS